MTKPWEKYQGGTVKPWEKYATKEPEQGFSMAGAADETARILDTAVRGAYAIPQMGAAGLASAASHLGELVPQSVQEKLPNVPGPFSTIRDFLAKKPEMQPKTTGGRVLGNVAASTVGAVAGGGVPQLAAKSIPQALSYAGIGTSAGLGGEAAGSLFPDQPLARIAGGLIGGAGYGLAEGSIRNAIGMLTGRGKRADVAKALMQGVDESQVDEAARFQQQAMDEQGVRLTGGQVLPGTNVPAFELMAAQYKQGAGLQQMFRAQPEQVRAATEAARSSVPGTARPLPEMATVGQKAATQAVKGARNWRSDLVRDKYAGQIRTETGAQIQQFLAQRLRETAQGTDDAQLISNLKNSLMKRAGSEVTPVVSIQEIQKQMRQVTKDASAPTLGGKPFSREARNNLMKTIDEVKQIIGVVKPETLVGNRQYARASNKVVNPLEEGTVGKMAGATGYISGKTTSQQALIKSLEAGTVRGAKSDILTTQKQLARFAGDEGKAAFNDTVKTWMANKLDNALTYEGGIPSPKIAENITNAFFKNDAQRQGLRDAIAGVARNTGADEAQLVRGMENYLRTMAAASKVPPKIGPDRTAINAEIDTILGKLNAITAFTPVRMPARFINEFFKRDAIGHTAKLLESPEGLKALYRLSRVQPGSAESYAVAAAFSSIVVQGQLADKQEK